MANRDEPQGLRPFGVVKRCNPYVAGGAIYPGDLVKKDAAGKVVAGTAGAAAIGVAATKAAADGDEVMVYDDPQQMFAIQVAADEVDAQTDIGLNASIVAGSANTTYNVSGHELDGSTINTTATLELKILRIVPAQGNALGANVDCVVLINNHQLGQGTGSAGV
jgi:hypothetical protein